MTSSTNNHALGNDEIAAIILEFVNLYLVGENINRKHKLPLLNSGSQTELRVGISVLSPTVSDYFFACDAGQYRPEDELDVCFEAFYGFAHIVVFTDGIYFRHSSESIVLGYAADRMREAFQLQINATN